MSTGFSKACIRLLQCVWLKDRGIPVDSLVRNNDDDAATVGFGSKLSIEAAHAGKNFLDPKYAAHAGRKIKFGR